jgi:hypothetical protein
MAVTSVREVFDRRSSKQNAQWQRTYTRVWEVETDSPYIGPGTARAAIPVSLGNHYKVLAADGTTVVEEDTGSFATEIEATASSHADDGCTFEVTVQYTPYDPTQWPQNPINYPIRVGWGFAKFETVVEEDKDGNKVTNSAGDYFDPPITMDDTRPLLKVTRNEATYNPAMAKTWKDTINSLTWNGFDPYTVKVGEITGDLQYNPECGFYFEVTYEFEIEVKGWRKLILDQGLRALDSGTGKQYAILDEKGEEITSPVLLDGSGNKLANGASPVYLSFKVYTEADFTPLNITLAGAPGQPATIP